MPTVQAYNSAALISVVEATAWTQPRWTPSLDNQFITAEDINNSPCNFSLGFRYILYYAKKNYIYFKFWSILFTNVFVSICMQMYIRSCNKLFWGFCSRCVSSVKFRKTIVILECVNITSENMWHMYISKSIQNRIACVPGCLSCHWNLSRSDWFRYKIFLMLAGQILLHLYIATWRRSGIFLVILSSES